MAMTSETIEAQLPLNTADFRAFAILTITVYYRILCRN